MSSEPATPDSATRDTEPPTTAMRLQILSTEHWSLLASRGLAWNESFTRTSMFLSTLSFGGVALALVAQATGFDQNFRLFALVVLPLVLFLGISTQLRLGSSNHHDALCVIGMNRIRAHYLAMAPELAPIFVMGTTDDVRGIARTMATQPGRPLALNLFAASPFQVSVLNGMLLGTIVALVAIQLNASVSVSLALGLVGVLGFVAGFAANARRAVERLMADNRPVYPGTPLEPDGRTAHL